MSTNTERVVLAGGRFWGMQDLIRRKPGVISTRVGYSGGDVKNATYPNHGAHAEAIEIIFDPRVLNFRGSTGILLPDSRSDHAQSAGQRYSGLMETSDTAG
jgi:peptide methionine sulfoxide reductase MsrA